MNEAERANLYMSYRSGWIAGASMGAVDDRFDKHENLSIHGAYEDGWQAGRKAKRAALKEAEGAYGWAPSILRLQNTEQNLSATGAARQVPTTGKQHGSTGKSVNSK